VAVPSFALVPLLSCVLAAPAAGRPAEPRRPPNLVLIVLDDFGVDLSSAFPRASDAPPPPCTPNLDALVSEGLLFTRVWTDPVCSPSRAQLLTGRHGFRTGIGMGIGKRPGSLRVDLEDPLPRMLIGYDSSAVGKWHLASQVELDVDHPLDAGFGYYAGSLFNLAERSPLDDLCRRDGRLSYSNWTKTYDVRGNGALDSRCSKTYATTDTADEAILRAKLMRPPWFLYVAFNAPHWPFHDPPPELCPSRLDCPARSCRPDARDPLRRVEAMVEALDTELGRFLAELRAHDPNTVVFVIGDNGSDPSARPADEEDNPEKGSLFEGGLHVPLIAAGPGVVRGECSALVSSTDLYATLAELAGVPAPAEDSISLAPYLRGETRPLRRTVYAEAFRPNQPCDRAGGAFAPEEYGRALRDERYKLVHLRHPGGPVEAAFYDLVLDPLERTNLLAREPALIEREDDAAHGLSGEARARYLALRDELRAMGLD
jgi:arylsulfatase A-like enzyme